METRSSLLCSQEPATDLYPKQQVCHDILKIKYISMHLTIFDVVFLGYQPR